MIAKVCSCVFNSSQLVEKDVQITDSWLEEVLCNPVSNNSTELAKHMPSEVYQKTKMHKDDFFHDLDVLGDHSSFGSLNSIHWGISSNGRAPASQAGGTGIDIWILQRFLFYTQNSKFPFTAKCRSLKTSEKNFPGTANSLTVKVLFSS